MAEKRKLFMNGCGGVDQAIALWYALQAPDVEVVGIGVASSEEGKGIRLVKKLVALTGLEGVVPVATGECGPLFGEGGQGQRESGQAAARLLVDKAKEHEGELTVVTLGPLTDLAKAVAIDPGLPNRLKQVVVQGGAIRVPGNATAVAEANLHADSEAAAFVLAAGLPLLLVPLDASEHIRLSPEARQEILSKAAGMGIGQASDEIGAELSGDGTRLEAWATMIATLHSEYVHTQKMKLTIECHSALSRGAVLADLRAKPSVGIDTQVAVDVDVEPFAAWLRNLSDADKERA